MKHRYLIFLGLVFGSCTVLLAQQTPMFTQYRENYSLINPAIINADRMAFDFAPNSKMSMGYRRQWTKLSDSPRTFSAQYEHILEDNNMTLGGFISSDALGPIANTAVTLRYAYQAYFSNYSYLSIGAASSIVQYSYRGTKGIFRDANDNIGFLDYNRTLLDFNLGANFVSEMANNDVLYTGISVPQTTTSSLGGRNPTSFGSGTDPEEFQVNQVSHVYMLLGYYKYLSDGLGNIGESVFLEPSVWIKYAKNAPVQADLHLRFQVTNAFWFGGGATLSSLDRVRQDNVHLEAGFNMQSQQYNNSDRAMKVGFGYDTNISAFGGVNLGPAYELNLTYSFVR